MPMNAPWLSDRYPVKPVMTLSPLAPMASTSARITVFWAETLASFAEVVDQAEEEA